MVHVHGADCTFPRIIPARRRHRTSIFAWVVGGPIGHLQRVTAMAPDIPAPSPVAGLQRARLREGCGHSHPELIGGSATEFGM